MALGGGPSGKIEIEVLEYPQAAAPQALNLQPEPKKQEPPPRQEVRKVFGVSEKSMQSDAGDVGVKAGNTVATAPDDLKLEPSDAGSLPIPTDEYLVSAMPVLQKEVRISYPPEAKARGVEGPVVMDLLIDDTGNVRDVKLVSGPGTGLDEAAVSAARGFRFQPAKVGDKAVAVRIRYTYRFVLER